MVTLKNIVAVAPSPFPLEGCSAAKWGSHSRVVASPGIAVATIAADGSLAWFVVLTPAQHFIRLQAVAVHGDSVRLYGGRPTELPSTPLLDVQEFGLPSGTLHGTTRMSEAREAMGAFAHPDGRTILVGGQPGGGGQPRNDGFLHLPGGADGLFDDLFVHLDLTAGVGVPTAPGVAMPQIVKVKGAGGSPRFLVLATGERHPSEIVRRNGTVKMVIATDITLPYASRSGGAASFRGGFVYAGGTDGNNSPTSQIVAWDGTPGTQPEVIGSLPHASVSPTVFASDAHVFVAGGYPGWGSDATAVATADAVRLEIA